MLKIFLAIIGLLQCAVVVAATPPVLTVADGLIDTTRPDSLGLPHARGVAHYRVFSAAEKVAQYNHGAVLFAFKGKLYCQWQTSAKDEDGPDTHVTYSTSQDGMAWRAPSILAPQRDGAIVTSGGWWSDSKTLVAFINVWPENLTPKAGHVEYALSQDGENWSEFKPVLNNQEKPVKGIIEQDLKSLPSGRVLTAIHHQPGLVATPFYTDDPLAISGWQAADFNNLPFDGSISRELEPSWFLTRNNEVVMTFRDQGSSYRILAARSNDNGQTWSPVTTTNFPDSRAKQSAGNLPDGSAYIVNNPTGNKTRMPLVIAVSPTGEYFTSAYILRDKDTLPAMQYAGKYKRAGYSYPKSYVWKNALWVSYAVNKEDIAVTRLDLAQFISSAQR
ncbi:sialidase family protein [Alteromonas gilva]|uniref:Exo-alpha-sialidase n=1 Tax=Alteromonas gilva TaxID=2987522 RepID=A0ABT5KZ38_9ALTE|nr:sialidase family protein [Alteromonas gilva]MDC8829903.1 exo-alpha-sialidase [Alteromonas gilva]